MNAGAILMLAFLGGALSLPRASDARPLAASKDWVGTWRLNVSRSSFGGSAARGETRTISLSSKTMSVRSSVVDRSGRIARFHYSVTLDGHFRPLVGNPDGDSIAMRLISPRKVSIVVRRGPSPSATATAQVSASQLIMDRHRLKLSGSPSEDILVYDRVR